jgi:peroxiredoxin
MRHAYLIDPDGVIHRRYDVKDVAAHASEVIADLEAAMGGSAPAPSPR